MEGEGQQEGERGRERGKAIVKSEGGGKRRGEGDEGLLGAAPGYRVEWAACLAAFTPSHGLNVPSPLPFPLPICPFPRPPLPLSPFRPLTPRPPLLLTRSSFLFPPFPLPFEVQ